VNTLLTVILIFAVSIVGCCKSQTRVEPSFPQKVYGWVERQDRGLRILGDFVLSKGESTDNGKIRVVVTDIIPNDPCAEPGTFQYQARAKMQFLSLVDGKVLCEDTFAEKGGASLVGEICGSSLSQYGMAAIYVISINVKDGWVFFELRA
jgi:hypothetical protein